MADSTHDNKLYDNKLYEENKMPISYLKKEERNKIPGVSLGALRDNKAFTDDSYEPYNFDGGKKKRLVRKPLDKCTILELKERAARRRINIKGLKTKAEILAKMRK